MSVVHPQAVLNSSKLKLSKECEILYQTCSVVIYNLLCFMIQVELCLCECCGGTEQIEARWQFI